MAVTDSGSVVLDTTALLEYGYGGTRAVTVGELIYDVRADPSAQLLIPSGVLLDALDRCDPKSRQAIIDLTGNRSAIPLMPRQQIADLYAQHAVAMAAMPNAVRVPVGVRHAVVVAVRARCYIATFEPDVVALVAPKYPGVINLAAI